MTTFELCLLSLGWFFAATRTGLTREAHALAAVNFYGFSAMALLRLVVAVLR